MSIEQAAPVAQSLEPKRLNNRRGLIFMALAFFMFAAADAQVKVLTSSLHPIQIVWTRQLGLLVGVLILLAVKGPIILRTRHPILQITRGALAVMSAVFFVYALSFVPLADAVAVTFIAPFMVTVMGALFLREPVGIRRWSAIAVGFIGTLIIIRPGLGVVHPAMMLVVLAATCFAARQVLSRSLAASDRTSTTIAYTSIASVALLSLPLPFVWITPEAPQQILLLISVAVFAALGELLVIKALEIALAVVVAPVHYSLIIWGTLYGWLIFGQLPDRWTSIGALIILATGLYVLNRERQLSREVILAKDFDPNANHRGQ
jgi:drug/metabolite transporter (DMT)-like permease